MTDVLNAEAVAFVERPRTKPWSLFFAHKAVHPDAHQAADGTLDLTRHGGYKPAVRHQDLYRGRVFPPRPNVLPPEEVVRAKPAWAEAFRLKATERAQAVLAAIHAGTQEEIRLRACMMASVDEGIGMLLDALERTGQLDRTCIVFLGDNGYFFGEHALGPERRFAYEEGIRSPFLVRYPPLVPAGSRPDALVLALDIAPTMLELAGGTPGPQVQGRSLVPLLGGRRPADWRTSFLVEYWSENAMPWLVGMSYKAVRTERGQAHPLGQPRRGGRAVRPRRRSLRAAQPPRRAGARARAGRPAARAGPAGGRGARALTRQRPLEPAGAPG